ncbi:hypothetical protein [Blastococcus sp. SYSU D00813]
MRARALSVAGACTAALLLGACSTTTGGTAAPAAAPGTAIASPGGDPSVTSGGVGVLGAVALPGEPAEDDGSALLAPDPGGDVLAFLRQLSAEGGDLSTLVALGLITPEGPDGGADAPGVISEDQLPAVDDPVLVDTGGDVAVVVGWVGEPGDAVRFGFQRLDRGAGAAVLVDAPVLAAADPDEVTADLAPDGSVLYLLVQAPDHRSVVLAVDPGNGAVLAQAEVPAPAGRVVHPRAVAAVPGGGLVTAVDVSVPEGGIDTTAVLTRWDAALAPAGAELVLAPDEEEHSTTYSLAVVDDGTAVAVVGTGVVALGGLRLVTVAGDVVTTVAELPEEALGPAALAVDPTGTTAYLALRDSDTRYAVLVVADLGAGTTESVELCRHGRPDDVAVADDGTVWVSGVCRDDAVVWAVG